MKKLLFITLLLSIGSFLAAHPHMWIDGYLQPVYNQSGLVALNIRWEFDEFSSSSMILSFDLDKNNRLSQTEIEDIRENGFNHLEEGNYFTVIWTDDREVRFNGIDRFTASIEEGKLIYDFTARVTIPHSSLDNTNLFFLDASYYVSFGTSMMGTSEATDSPISYQYVKELSSVETNGWGTIETYVIRIKRSS